MHWRLRCYNFFSDCKNLCEAVVHPFEDAEIGVRDEINVEDVRISNDIYLAIERL